MTDTLIARLRDMAFAPYSPKLMFEAADRINALQSELGRLYREHTEDLDAASDAMEFAEKERDQLRAEVERLKVFIESAFLAHPNLDLDIDSAKKEREAIDAFRDSLASGAAPQQAEPKEQT